MARETELKFAVPDDFAMPDLGVPEAAVRELAATYYDAEDLRLAREGITARHRGTWTVKLPLGPNTRDEIEVSGLDEAAELLTGWLRGAPLVPVAELRQTRRTWVLPGAEVVDDAVAVVDGDEVRPVFREVEVEATGDEPLDAVAELLTAAGAAGGEFVPKLVRTLGPRAAEPPDLPPPGPVSKSDPASAAVALSLRTNVRRLLTHDPGVRRDLPDAVHQMRVACRRLRSDLRTFGPLVDAEWAGPLRDELAWLAGELGAARDLEVLAERLPPMAEVLTERRVAALAAGQEALRSQRYVDLVSALVEAAREPRVTPAAVEKCRKALPSLVAVAWKSLARKGRRLEPESPAEDFHRARILAKRARYAAEAVAPILGAQPRRFAEAVTRVQEVLGESQDAAIAQDFLAGVAVERPDLCFEAGRLAEREHVAGVAARRRFFEVWPKVDRPKVRAWTR